MDSMIKRILKLIKNANFVFKSYVSSFIVASATTHCGTRFSHKFHYFLKILIIKISLQNVNFVRNLKKQIFGFFSLIGTYIYFSFSAFANSDDLPFENDYSLPAFYQTKWSSWILKLESPYYFILVIIKQIVIYTWIISIIAIMIGWIMFLTSMWKEEQFKKAKNVIIYSIVWVVVSISSYALVDIINNLSLK